MRARRKQKSWYESKPSFPISLSTLPDTGELSITALDLEQYSKLALTVLLKVGHLKSFSNFGSLSFPIGAFSKKIPTIFQVFYFDVS